MMNENPTPDEVRKSIVPDSSQLNADDLLTGPLTVTITGVKRGSRDQPIIVEIKGHRPYKPCKSMRRVLIAVFSDDPKKWIGKQVTLYCDPDVVWAGVKVGGIRISHLSGLEKPKTFLLTQTRGKRAEYTIQPLGNDSTPKCTNKAGWKVSPDKRAALALQKAEEVYKKRDLEGLKAKLDKLTEIGTDFPDHDLETLQGMIQSWVAELELQHGSNHV